MFLCAAGREGELVGSSEYPIIAHLKSYRLSEGWRRQGGTVGIIHSLQKTTEGEGPAHWHVWAWMLGLLCSSQPFPPLLELMIAVLGPRLHRNSMCEHLPGWACSVLTCSPLSAPSPFRLVGHRAGTRPVLNC